MCNSPVNPGTAKPAAPLCCWAGMRCRRRLGLARRLGREKGCQAWLCQAGLCQAGLCQAWPVSGRPIALKLEFLGAPSLHGPFLQQVMLVFVNSFGKEAPALGQASGVSECWCGRDRLCELPPAPLPASETPTSP